MLPGLFCSFSVVAHTSTHVPRFTLRRGCLATASTCSSSHHTTPGSMRMHTCCCDQYLAGAYYSFVIMVHLTTAPTASPTSPMSNPNQHCIWLASLWHPGFPVNPCQAVLLPGCEPNWSRASRIWNKSKWLSSCRRHGYPSPQGFKLRL